MSAVLSQLITLSWPQENEGCATWDLPRPHKDQLVSVRGRLEYV